MLSHSLLFRRGPLEIFTHAISVHVLELVAVLLMKRDLAFEEHVAEVNDLWDVSYFKGLAQDLVPESEHVADIVYCSPSGCRFNLISVLIELKLHLEAEIDHAGC